MDDFLSLVVIIIIIIPVISFTCIVGRALTLQYIIDIPQMTLTFLEISDFTILGTFGRLNSRNLTSMTKIKINTSVSLRSYYTTERFEVLQIYL